MLTEVCQNFGGYSDRLEAIALRVGDEADLSQGAVNAVCQFGRGRLLPFRHGRIAVAALVEVFVPELARKVWAEKAKLLAHHEVEEVAQQRRVLDGTGEHGMRRYAAGPVADQLPEFGRRCREAASDEGCLSL